jgi:23S rRNA (cytidine2498-2'-O)-methyltransferase
MDEIVQDHPHFTHLRKRVADVKRREFRSVKWLFTDSNIAPKDSLDDVEAIVTHPDVRIRGLLLTLKLSDWDSFVALPEFVERVRSWGFREVTTRQLAFNRREICLAAKRSTKDSAHHG